MLIAIYRCFEGHLMTTDVRDHLIARHPVQMPCPYCHRETNRLVPMKLEKQGWSDHTIPDSQFYVPTEAEWTALRQSCTGPQMLANRHIVHNLKGMLLRPYVAEAAPAEEVITEHVYNEDIYD